MMMSVAYKFDVLKLICKQSAYDECLSLAVGMICYGIWNCS